MRYEAPTAAPALLLLAAALVLASVSVGGGPSSRGKPAGSPPPPVPAPLPLPTPVPDPVREFREFLKTAPSSADLVKRIGDLSALRRPEVADALRPILVGARYDDAAKVAACRVVGKQGDRGAGILLTTMADSKAWAGKPSLIVAALEGAGEADPMGCHGELLKFGKKYLDLDADIASAAFRAASRRVDRETVDELIRELERACFIRESDGARKKSARAGTRPVLVDLLKSMTGKNIDDVFVWREWWSDNKKTWKPPVPAAEPPVESDRPDAVSDDRWGFEIRRPGRAWSIRQERRRMPCITLETVREGSRVAWVEVFAAVTAPFPEKTPADWAGLIRGQLAGEFRPSGTPEWGKPCVHAGMAGVEQALAGAHRAFGPVRMRNLFLERNGVVYYLLCTWKDGREDHIEADIEAILGSFRLTR